MDGHIICIGTPGSGKSAAVATPYVTYVDRRTLAIDIKGELLKNAPVRYNRRVMDPYNPDSYGYDPFELLYLAPKSEFTHALNDILYAIIPDRDTEGSILGTGQRVTIWLVSIPGLIMHLKHLSKPIGSFTALPQRNLWIKL